MILFCWFLSDSFDPLSLFWLLRALLMLSCFEPAPKDGSPWLPLIRGDFMVSLCYCWFFSGCESSLSPISFLEASNFWKALFARSLPKLFIEFDLSTVLATLFFGLSMKLLTVVTGLFWSTTGEIAWPSSSLRWWTPDNLLLYSFAHWLNRSSARPAISPN